MPECLRMNPPSTVSAGETLQRSMSMVSIDDTSGPDANADDKPPTQVMSVSDDEELIPKTGDWADQMQQESDDRRAMGKFHFRWFKILKSIGIRFR